MSLDKLKAYKLDRAFTEGVEIRLDNAPDVVFLVRLPSQYNRAYTQAVYGGMGFDVGEGGQVRPSGDLLATRYAQEDGFLDHCLLAIDGEPPPENFRTEYPEALIELMAKANELAAALSDKVENTVKKSSASSTGSENGPAGKSSIASLNSGAG